jgi:hydroxyacylglutathione hydrolase
LHDGDSIMVGTVRLDVRHTPGHTPEHLSFVVTDTATSDLPMGVATGDFLFVGDVGRPDLLERSLGVQDSMSRSAATLFHSLQALRGLPEYLQIWPGHGAGSACGKSLSAVPQSTLGYELRANWAFDPRDEASFIRQVLADLPEPPAYFGRVKALNARGGLAARPRPGADERSLREAATHGALVVDTRPFDRFAAGHLEGALAIPIGRGFLEWAGSVADPDRDMVLLADPSERTLADAAVHDLALIGFERVLGVLAVDDVGALSSGPLRTIDSIPAHALGRTPGRFTPVDVRYDAEWRIGHVPGALHVPLSLLVARVDELRGRGPLAVYCQGGSRSAIAVSVLRAAGIPDVANVDGGFAEWQRSGGAEERGS